MSNIIPFPTHKTTQGKKKTYHNFNFGNWTVDESTMTFTDADGVTITLDVNGWEQSAYYGKSDYLDGLLFDLQNAVEADPACAEYVCENLERLLRTVKKQL